MHSDVEHAYRVSLKIFTNSSLRVFTSSTSGLRLFSLRLRSDTKIVGSKCFMHLNLGLEFYWVGWWRLKFTKIGKWSEISIIVISELFFYHHRYLCICDLIKWFWIFSESGWFIDKRNTATADNQHNLTHLNFLGI